MLTGTFSSKHEYEYACGHTTEIEPAGSPARVCEECGSGLLKPPKWSFFTHRYDYKPDFADIIPKELWKLGEVFFPIPRGEKGHSYPHHMDEYRHPADSEHLNAYLEAGWGYGVVMAGDLVVIDIDNLAFFERIYSKLPDTMWQISGSGEGVHLFYLVEGLDTRVTLHYNHIYDALDMSNVLGLDITKQTHEYRNHWYHIGEVKCDPHGYVVGPGSVHPSGNKYGPLEGDEMAEVSKESILSVLEPYRKPEVDESDYTSREEYDEDSGADDVHSLYNIEADEILPNLKEGKRIGHPVASHGSTTGTNFMKNDDGDTFTCWHCQHGASGGCGLNGAQYLAVKATSMDCSDVRRYWGKDSVLHYKAWLQGVEDGLLDYRNPPYNAVEGYGIDNGYLSRDNYMTTDLYWMIEQMLEWEAMSEVRW